MSTSKSERTVSKNEFDALYYRIHDDAEDMIEHNFRAKGEIVDQNANYIMNAADALRRSVWDLIYFIKAANALYPTAYEELMERRICQERAIGICTDMLTLYEIVMHRLEVKDDMGVTEIKNIRHQMNAIRAWRTSDNRRFRDLK